MEPDQNLWVRHWEGLWNRLRDLLLVHASTQLLWDSAPHWRKPSSWTWLGTLVHECSEGENIFCLKLWRQHCLCFRDQKLEKTMVSQCCLTSNLLIIPTSTRDLRVWSWLWFITWTCQSWDRKVSTLLLEQRTRLLSLLLSWPPLPMQWQGLYMIHYSIFPNIF